MAEQKGRHAVQKSIVGGAVVAVGVAAALVLAAVVESQDSGTVDDGRVHVSPGPDVPESPDPSVAADLAKPRYQGPMGDFLVTPGDAAQHPPCGPFGPADSSRAATSELYVPGFTIASANQCADGTIIVIKFLGPEAPETLGRRYFIGAAQVPFEAPADRLQLLTVGGKPAIAELAMPDYTHTLRLVVIERFPEVGQPGILVSVQDTFRSVEEAAALAAQFMGAE